CWAARSSAETLESAAAAPPKISSSGLGSRAGSWAASPSAPVDSSAVLEPSLLDAGGLEPSGPAGGLAVHAASATVTTAASTSGEAKRVLGWGTGLSFGLVRDAEVMDVPAPRQVLFIVPDIGGENRPPLGGLRSPSGLITSAGRPAATPSAQASSSSSQSSVRVTALRQRR